MKTNNAGSFGEAWRWVNGGADIEVRIDGQWVLWSTGPYVAEDLESLREAGVPREDEDSRPPTSEEEAVGAVVGHDGRLRGGDGRFHRV